MDKKCYHQTLLFDSTKNLFLIICFVFVLHQPIIMYNLWGLDGFLIVLSWWVGFMGVKLQMCNVHTLFLDVFHRLKF